MASLKTTNIYLTIQKDSDGSHIEDQLVLAMARMFPASLLLMSCGSIFRFVPSDLSLLISVVRGFDGMELVRKIRKDYQTPYVYVLMRSVMGQLKDIKEGLNLGIDDYLILPHNPFQIRSRVLVGMRWLSYIDSITGTSKA